MIARWLPVAFLACAIACADTIVIDCGSAIDPVAPGVVGSSFPWTISDPLLPPGADATLRFGPSFLYDIVVPVPAGAANNWPGSGDNWPYVVTLRFVEPSVKAANQRLFTVKIAQPQSYIVLDQIDVWKEAGYLKPLAKTFVAVPVNGHIVIMFSTQVRSAVISSIELKPLIDAETHASGIMRMDAGNLSVTGSPTLPAWRATSGWSPLRFP